VIIVVAVRSRKRLAGRIRDAHALGLACPPFLLGFQRLRFLDPTSAGKLSSDFRDLDIGILWYFPSCHGRMCRFAHRRLICEVDLQAEATRGPTCGEHLPARGFANVLERRVPVPVHGDGRGFRTAKPAKCVVIPVKRPGTGRHLNEIDELPIAGTDAVEA
jgi:hypothetical protein